MHRGEVLDRAGDANCFSSSRIDRKGQGAVGKGVGDGTMGDAKSVDHVRPNGHAANTLVRPTLQHIEPQPLAEGIIVHHLGHNRVKVLLAHCSNLNQMHLKCSNGSRHSLQEK